MAGSMTAVDAQQFEETIHGHPMDRIHEEIYHLLISHRATYARPLNSNEIGHALNVTPSYVREQAGLLIRLNMVAVRRGRGGGYYVLCRIRTA